MARSVKFTCDVCGAEKRETNHWWMMRKLASSVSGWAIDLHPWSRACEDRPDTRHLCGESCVVAAVSSCMRDNGKEAA